MKEVYGHVNGKMYCFDCIKPYKQIVREVPVSLDLWQCVKCETVYITQRGWQRIQAEKIRQKTRLNTISYFVDDLGDVMCGDCVLQEKYPTDASYLNYKLIDHHKGFRAQYKGHEQITFRCAIACATCGKQLQKKALPEKAKMPRAARQSRGTLKTHRPVVVSSRGYR